MSIQISETTRIKKDPTLNSEPINILQTEKPFSGKIINVRVDKISDENKKTIIREVVEHKPAVAIVPIDDEDNVIMVRQYRHPASLNLLEIPAGIIENDEEPDAAALRELQEEIGYTSTNIRLLGGFWSSPGFTDEYMYGYLARNLVESHLPADEDEEISVEKIPINKIQKLIKLGEIQDAKSIALLLMVIYLF
ncbi:MAG: ADP-ribose pyrophosphatase [Chloroflexi bacterium]|nr:ADP-ribose pyrophosphatase [Chloroflexota bacterium]